MIYVGIDIAAAKHASSGPGYARSTLSGGEGFLRRGFQAGFLFSLWYSSTGCDKIVENFERNLGERFGKTTEKKLLDRLPDG